MTPIGKLAMAIHYLNCALDVLARETPHGRESVGKCLAAADAITAELIEVEDLEHDPAAIALAAKINAGDPSRVAEPVDVG